MYINAYYFNCEEQYIVYLENSINTILADTSESACTDPSVQIKRFFHAKDFLKEFTQAIGESIRVMRYNIYLLSSKRIYPFLLEEEARREGGVKNLCKEIEFKQHLLQKYNIVFFDLLDQLIDGEEKRLPQISESVQ